MNDGIELITIATTLLVGAVLGIVFFGGLWWTVRRGAASVKPARWFVGSLVLRTALVLTGFYLVGAGESSRLGMCMAGFLLGRIIVVRFTRPSACDHEPPASGVPPCA